MEYKDTTENLLLKDKICKTTLEVEECDNEVSFDITDEMEDKNLIFYIEREDVRDLIEKLSRWYQNSEGK